MYEKVRQGIWVYTGLFHLVDAWFQDDAGRQVCKFKLSLVDRDEVDEVMPGGPAPVHSRIIPTDVKLEVWRRDGGKCIKCGADENLHFDRVIPYSKGGSSLVVENVQLLCARHNLEKRDRPE